MSPEPLPEPPPRPPPGRPDPIALVWIGGIALATLAYLVGPDQFVGEALSAVQRAAWYVEDLARHLSVLANTVMRAAAVGLFGVFAALSVLAVGRTGRGRLGLVVVTVVFVLLVWGREAPASNARWLTALVLVAIAAVNATRRLAESGAPPLPWRRPPSR